MKTNVGALGCHRCRARRESDALVGDGRGLEVPVAFSHQHEHVSERVTDDQSGMLSPLNRRPSSQWIRADIVSVPCTNPPVRSPARW